MRRQTLAACLLSIALVVSAVERLIDDTDENSEDVFERPPRLEAIDNAEHRDFGVAPLPGEIEFHRHPHGGFPTAVDDDDDDVGTKEENLGSDGFPRLTAMVEEEPAAGAAAAAAANETDRMLLLPLPKSTDERPVDGIRTDTRTGANKVVGPFPTLLAGGPDDEEEDRETIIQLTLAPNLTSAESFGSALAQGEHAPVMEYDLEDGKALEGDGSRSAEEELERNLTAAVVFQASNATTLPTLAAAAAVTPESTSAAATPTTDQVTPDHSTTTLRDRAGIFPSESTEQLTAHGRPTVKPPTSTSTEPNDATDPPFAMVDPTIFSPDHLFAVPGAPGAEDEHAHHTSEIEEEDSELKEALSLEAHLPTSTVDSIMTSIAIASTSERIEKTPPAGGLMTSSTRTSEETSTTTSAPSSTTTTNRQTPSTMPTLQPAVETTTVFQLPPLIPSSSPSSTHSPSTTDRTTTEQETVSFNGHAHFENRPEPTAAAEEVHFEDRDLSPSSTTSDTMTSESTTSDSTMPFATDAAHFGDSDEEEEQLWRSTHGQEIMQETTTTEPLIAHKTPFQLSLAELEYFPEFADPDSGKFRKLRDQVLPELRRHFDKSLPDFIAVDLTSVDSEKKTVVHGVVYTRNTIVDLYETANKIEAALEQSEMQLGGNGIEPASFTINGINARAPVERVQQAAASTDSSIAFIIAGIITIGVIVILIVVFVIILMNNHRRGVGSMKLKEDAEAEAGRRAQMHYGNVNLMSYNSPPPPQPPSTQLLQQLPHVIINTKSGSRPNSTGRASTLTSPTHSS